MKKYTTARTITLILVPLAVLIGIFIHTGTGALSSFGWKDIAAICPLGTIEAFLASWIPVPRALIVLVLVFAFTIIFGKIFCAWVCPVPPLRKFFRGSKSKNGNKSSETNPSAETTEPNETASAGISGAHAAAASIVMATATDTVEPALSSTLTSEQAASLSAALKSCPAESTDKSAQACSATSCSTCAEKRRKLDSRHLVLGGALLSTAIFGFPVFCLVCPVGLSFATLLLLWRLIGFSEVSWSLLVFPVILVVELLVLRKWCLKFCPLGALMSLMSLPNKLFRPHVNTQKCLRLKGEHCTICVDICEEGLDPHSHEGMHECTKCGLCVDHCPAHAVTIPVRPTKSKPS